MKIDKSKLNHWVYLAIFFCNVLLTLPLSLLPRCKSKKRIIVYGHKLSGNLLGIYNESLRTAHSDLDVYFLTMDYQYYCHLRNKGISVLYALYPNHIAQVSLCHALVSDHGLHSLILFLFVGRMKFIDMWHGIPFKGFDADDFRVQHHYDRILLPSERMLEFYTKKFGFKPDRLIVTGYARTDVLITKRSLPSAEKPQAIKSNSRRIIMFAPTWKHESADRSIFPFDMSPTDFIENMQIVCEDTNAVCLLRTHLNSGIGSLEATDRIINCPFENFPDTEQLLLSTDILICDWSSIAFDFLLLDRPTIFLDVPHPFKKGFSLGPEYRYGDVVKNSDQMLKAVMQYLKNPAEYYSHYISRHISIKSEVYENWADGAAARRCLEEIETTIISG